MILLLLDILVFDHGQEKEVQTRLIGGYVEEVCRVAHTIYYILLMVVGAK